MGFSPEIREAALVASARHCCVCRRYAGVKIEVHHVLPRAKGGDDSFENAIPLCFDCHADAGHYNPDHPRGTRFSPTELRRHRDEWFALVRSGAVSSVSDPNLIYARHLVCRGASAIEEICAGELSRLPVNHPRIWENGVLQFVRDFQAGRRVRKLAAEYRSLSDARRAHPTVTGIESLRGSGEVRVPVTAAHMRSALKDSDALTCKLLDEGVPLEELIYSYLYHNECGTEAFYHFVDTRHLWVSFLAIENASETSIVIEALHGGDNSTRELRYRPIVRAGSPLTSVLPPVPLEPGRNVLLPQAVILAPFEDVGFTSDREQEGELNHGQMMQVMRHGRFVEKEPACLRLVGPALHIERVAVRAGGRAVQCVIHPFDPSSVYVLDRHWLIGCCPQVFYHSRAAGWRYGGSILAVTGSGLQVTVQRRIPPDCDIVRVWELEFETTHIESICLDDRELLTNACCLVRGQWIDVPSTGAQVLELSGWYDSAMPASLQDAADMRMMIQDALAELRTQAVETVGSKLGAVVGSVSPYEPRFLCQEAPAPMLGTL